MEHVTEAPPVASIIDGKYTLGACLAERDGQAVYETTYNGEPAIIKIFRPRGAREATDLLTILNAARALEHERLIAIYDSAATTGPSGERTVYVVMERAEETLAGVLRERVLTAEEAGELLRGLVASLRYLHANGLVHGRLHPPNVFACGDRVKLSSDRLQWPDVPRIPFESAGLRDAPETSGGAFGTASDVYSLGILILEAMTGSPLAKGVERLEAPFRGIVEGCIRREPQQRLRLDAIGMMLQPKAPVEPEMDIAESHGLRGKGGMAVAAVLVAAALIAFLIRGAHERPAPAPAAAASEVVTAARVPEPAVRKPAPPAPHSAAAVVGTGAWAVVGAAYRHQADAEKRAARIRKAHPALNPTVTPAEPNAPRYLVTFGTGLTDTEAARLLEKVRRAGAPADSYRTKLR